MYLDIKITAFMKHTTFLAYDILNSDTSNNIAKEIAKYMSDTTKAIHQSSKRQKRGFQNESKPSKGKQKISHVYLCKNSVRLIERN